MFIIVPFTVKVSHVPTDLLSIRISLVFKKEHSLFILWYLYQMVTHVAHALRKIGLFEEEKILFVTALV